MYRPVPPSGQLASTDAAAPSRSAAQRHTADSCPACERSSGGWLRDEPRVAGPRCPGSFLFAAAAAGGRLGRPLRASGSCVYEPCCTPS
eukprot:scaffold389_cov382-Prasinococcus_capsulatus_cf.AAC.28